MCTQFKKRKITVSARKKNILNNFQFTFTDSQNPLPLRKKKNVYFTDKYLSTASNRQKKGYDKIQMCINSNTSRQAQTVVTGAWRLSKQLHIKSAALTQSGHPDLDTTPPLCFLTFLHRGSLWLWFPRSFGC